MSNLRLGFFPDFKSEDVVLLDGSPSAIDTLANAIRVFVASNQNELSVDGIATVGPSHPAELIVTRSADARRNGGGAFEWRVSAQDLPAVLASLANLAGASCAHQYFELVGSQAQLLVSVGEYGESWWHTHG